MVAGTEYSLGDALRLAFNDSYSREGLVATHCFDGYALEEEDFAAAREVLPPDASWAQVLEFAGRNKAMLRRIACDFTATMYEEDLTFET